MKKNILPFFLLIFLGFSSESPCLQQPIKTQNKKFFLGLLPDNASHKWIKSVLKESLEEILEEDKSNQCHLLSQLFLTLWANENRYHVTVLNEKLFLDTSQPKIKNFKKMFQEAARPQKSAKVTGVKIFGTHLVFELELNVSFKKIVRKLFNDLDSRGRNGFKPHVSILKVSYPPSVQEMKFIEKLRDKIEAKIKKKDIIFHFDTIEG